ncbi:MAG: hypothetical protein J6M48_07700 [Ruminococcus sp.]|nr:hypothetical protein [Ruminococcus sp.]
MEANKKRGHKTLKIIGIILLMYLPHRRLTNRSQRLQSLSVVQLPELSPMPSKTAHKSLIGFLSLGFRGNKKGLDPSAFTFRENH